VFLLCAAAEGSLGSALAPAALFTVGWLIALRTAYRGIHYVFGSAIRAAVGTAVGLVAVSALDFWLGRPVPASTLIACAVSIFALAAVWESACQRVLGGGRRVLIIGTGSSAWEVVDAVRRSEGMRFSVLGAVGQSRPDEPFAGAPTLGTIADLKGIVEDYRPDLVVLADDEAQEAALNRLLETRNASFKVATVASFFEYAFGRVPLPCLPPSWFLSILHLRQRPYSRFAKRAFDVVVASIGLVVTAPISAVIAGLVRLSPGPIIYRQTRVGQGGKPFTMYKFRTMRADAEAEGALFAAERDPRTTRVGRFVRMTHLDELPQLWDVLKGDMSIVGPRPERPEFVPMLEGTVPYFTRRLLVNGNHGLGAAALGLRLRLRQRRRQALVRPLVPPQPQPARRPRDLREDLHVDHAETRALNRRLRRGPAGIRRPRRLSCARLSVTPLGDADRSRADRDRACDAA
jgi:hypothetical protein